MTHEELLAKIDEMPLWEIAQDYNYNNPTFNLDDSNSESLKQALRAVVELHEPIQENGGGLDNNGEELWVCTHCPDGDGLQDYPCPTIQAIQEQLK